VGKTAKTFVLWEVIDPFHPLDCMDSSAFVRLLSTWNFLPL